MLEPDVGAELFSVRPRDAAGAHVAELISPELKTTAKTRRREVKREDGFCFFFRVAGSLATCISSSGNYRSQATGLHDRGTISGQNFISSRFPSRLRAFAVALNFQPRLVAATLAMILVFASSLRADEIVIVPGPAHDAIVPATQPDLPSDFATILRAEEINPGVFVVPTTQPSAHQIGHRPAPPVSTATDADIRQWVADLADGSSSVRSHARENLMGLTRADLPRLRTDISATLPLLPGQLVVLEDVVKQVFLAEEDYDADLAHGFLGLHWPIMPSDDDMLQSQGPIVVADRLPGFSAYRMLQPGDVILRVSDLPNVPMHNRMEFIEAMKQIKPGQKLHLQIQRQGEVLPVIITPDSKPQGMLDPTDIDLWSKKRDAAADDYWNKEFAPKVGSDGLVSGG